MADILTPDQVIVELNRLMGESQRGIHALYDAEAKVAYADADYEHAFSSAIIGQDSGTAQERVARAKLDAADKKLALDLAKAELSRVKAKLRAIDSAQVAVSVIAKQVELMYRHA
jgi:hypothetical protein